MMGTKGPERDSRRGSWSFLSWHGLALLLVAGGAATGAEVSSALGVPDLEAHRLLADLAAAGYLTRLYARRRAYRLSRTATVPGDLRALAELLDSRATRLAAP